MTGQPIKFRQMSSTNPSGIFNDDATSLPITAAASTSVVTRSNSNVRHQKTRTGGVSSTTMFKRNQALLSGGLQSGKNNTYMTGFNPGSAVRPSSKIRGEISSQASGYVNHGGVLGSASSYQMDATRSGGGVNATSSFVAAAPSGGASHESSSPQIAGTEMIDLPPDVRNANKLAQRFEGNKFGNGSMRAQRVKTAPSNAQRRRYTTNTTQGTNV